jgi:hypothetical protein
MIKHNNKISNENLTTDEEHDKFNQIIWTHQNKSLKYERSILEEHKNPNKNIDTCSG